MGSRWAKPPFPWFGGKSYAAALVWAALGDVAHYVEPFAGGLAVLLKRPHPLNRAYYSETVNDVDGLLVNAWRGIQLYPDETAYHASWPVTEADMTARHVALVRWRTENDLERLFGDPLWCDPMIAGWWLWGIACWIGGRWCRGEGPWWPDDNGRMAKNPSSELGVPRQIPHLGDDGQGVNSAALREPGLGVHRKKPHLGDDGRGVNGPQLREQGVDTDIVMPQLTGWLRWLSNRLRHVRILNGDWKRALTPAVVQTLSVRIGDDHAGVFLDPPYVNHDEFYQEKKSLPIGQEVAEWAIANGDDPKLRIVLAGFAGDYEMPSTWRCVEWFRRGYLRGGMSQQSEEGTRQINERLWLSPHCLGSSAQMDLWSALASGDEADKIGAVE